MRYLRTLSNSLVAALLGTSYVLVLFLQLNPRLSIAPANLIALVTTVGAFYLVHLGAAFYLVLVMRHLLAVTPFSPAWVSVSVLTWLGSATAAGGAVLMWHNLRTFDVVLAPETRSVMSGGALVLAACAIAFAIVAMLRRAAESEHRRVWAAAAAAIAVASVGVPLALRGPGRPTPLESAPLETTIDDSAVETHSGRVRIVAMDAGSLEFVTDAAARGRLPNFGRILDRGAVMHLATIHPTSAEAVWSAVATGKLPPKNGVRSAGVFHLAGGQDTIRLLPDYCFANRLVRFGFLVDEPYDSAAIRTRPFWSIFSLQGISVGVVNWPLTYPAPPVRGYIVSDVYSRLAPTVSGYADEAMLYPPELRQEALPIARSVSGDPESRVPLMTDAVLDERYLQAGRTDLVYDRIASVAADNHPTKVTAVRFQSLDTIGHYFLRYAQPAAFGEAAAARDELGPVLESHYAVVDAAIGRAIADLGPSDLLLVVSGYGMEPLSFGKRMLERAFGDPELNGTHESAPDGFLMAYGGPVAQGRFDRASVVDILPTLLYFLGLPIGRDMDGHTRTDVFQRQFTDERPIAFIPTYDQ